MKLKPETFERLGEILARQKTLSLEGILALFYKRPCRRVFEHSQDDVIVLLEALPGSIVVIEEEVIIVCEEMETSFSPALFTNDSHRIFVEVEGGRFCKHSSLSGFDLRAGSSVIHQLEDARIITHILSDEDLGRHKNRQLSLHDRWGVPELYRLREEILLQRELESVYQ